MEKMNELLNKKQIKSLIKRLEAIRNSTSYNSIANLRPEVIDLYPDEFQNQISSIYDYSLLQCQLLFIHAQLSYIEALGDSLDVYLKELKPILEKEFLRLKDLLNLNINNTEQ